MTSPPRRRPLLLLCGDSLTQRGSELAFNGWVALLQQAHVRSIDIVNRGHSGYNTRWFCENALPAIRHELQHAVEPALITLWLGANDAALVDGPAQRQHVPLDEYKQNLLVILREFQQLAPRAKILVVTPPVVDDDHRRRIRVRDFGASPEDPTDRTNEQARAYAQACSETVATPEGVALLDMHAFLMAQFPNAHDRAALLSDGLHFSAEGNRVVFEQIQQTIRTLLPECIMDNWQLPDWKTLS